MEEEGRISWYPWGVQITVTCLAVARVDPGGVERMLKKCKFEEWRMETRISAKKLKKSDGERKKDKRGRG